MSSIRSIEGALRNNGFSITYVPTTAARIWSFESPVNIVSYNGAKSGRLTALVPAFGDIISKSGESLNAAIATAYRSAGVHPVFVEDRFHTVNESLHCAVQVLN